MPTVLEAATLAQLKGEVARRETALKEEEGRIQTRLDLIRAELNGSAMPTVTVGPAVKPKRRAGRPKGSKKSDSDAPRESLKDVVLRVLAMHRAGLTLDDLAEAVKATGYTSKAKKFNTVLYQTIFKMDSVQREKETGIYHLGS